MARKPGVYDGWGPRQAYKWNLMLEIWSGFTRDFPFGFMFIVSGADFCDFFPGRGFASQYRRGTAVFLTSRKLAARVVQISAPAHEEGRGFRKSASAETPQ
jgi:hypothetical protein